MCLWSTKGRENKHPKIIHWMALWRFIKIQYIQKKNHQDKEEKDEEKERKNLWNKKVKPRKKALNLNFKLSLSLWKATQLYKCCVFLFLYLIGNDLSLSLSLSLSLANQKSTHSFLNVVWMQRKTKRFNDTWFLIKPEENLFKTRFEKIVPSLMDRSNPNPIQFECVFDALEEEEEGKDILRSIQNTKDAGKHFKGIESINYESNHFFFLFFSLLMIKSEEEGKRKASELPSRGMKFLSFWMMSKSKCFEFHLKQN